MLSEGNQELRERLDLIGNMIAEGRHVTGNWGWAFVLWGVAYYVAFAWASSGWNSIAAWPATMVVAAVVSGVMGNRRARNRPRTGAGRAIGSIWLTMGTCLFVVMISLGFA